MVGQVARATLLASALLTGCATDDVYPREAPGEPTSSAAEPQPADDGAAAYAYRGPEPVDPAEAGIGGARADVTFTDLAGRERRLSDLWSQGRGLVVVCTSLTCPVTKAYAPRLSEIAAACEQRGFAFLALDPAVQDGADALRAKAERMGWEFPLAQDPDYALSDALGVRRTADAFVVDARGVLRYRGAVDDQIGIGYRLPAPRRRHLLEALDALAAGEAVAAPANEAPGCLVSRVKLH